MWCGLKLHYKATANKAFSFQTIISMFCKCELGVRQQILMKLILLGMIMFYKVFKYIHLKYSTFFFGKVKMSVFSSTTIFLFI